MTGAAGVLALLCACAETAESDDTRVRWVTELDAIGIEGQALTQASITFGPDVEPGVLPDGSLRLPATWRVPPDPPERLARLAHLARHIELGLLSPEALGSCDAWRLRMTLLELDGLAREALVLQRLDGLIEPDSLANQLSARVSSYTSRCQ